MVKSIFYRKGSALPWAQVGITLATLTLLACNGNDARKHWPGAPVISTLSPVDGATGVAFNVRPSVVFNMAMTPLSGAIFTLAQGTTQIPGAVTNSADGLTATFIPSSPLAPSSVFTATITNAAKSSTGWNIDSALSWRFTTTAEPTVSSKTPVANATAVAITSPIVANFSKVMDPLTITTSTFTLSQGGAVLPGSVVNGPGNSATLTPANPLSYNTVYSAALTTGVKDLQGNPLAAAVVWTFTTTANPDTTPPVVNSTTPAANATGVAVSANLTATFSEPIDATTLTAATFTVTQGSTPVAGAVTYVAGTSIATFTPTSPLSFNTAYTANLSTGIKDLAGNGLAAAKTWSFTTAPVPDTTPPAVASTNPATGATSVALNATVSANFTEALDPTTVTNTSFTLMQGTTPVLGAAVYGPGITATFTPASPLSSNLQYTATLSTSIKDLAGNALAGAFVWSFTTGATAAKGPAVVNLGTAGDYVILAETGISTVPSSAVTGDIGLSPAAATFITGFSLVADATNVFATSPQIVGKAFAANYAVPTPSNLTTAVGNMLTAYTDAAGRPTPDFLNLGSGNIGGLTLAPGLYNWTSTITIPTDVVISGGANDVWIFQTSGDLSMSSAKNITLAGGAQAKNIFWQVAGQVSVGTGAHFEGIILCQTQVTLQTLATMNGRILAQTMVALDQATVTKPAL